jgi:adenylosuccinate synthase
MKLKQAEATLILGAQYGDEGKGKLVDYLAQQADLVCRVQGGNNAGHTIWVKGEKLVTHLMPSGVLHPTCKIALGAGVVIDPLVLVTEMKMIQQKGIELSPKRFFIDARAHVILPYHKLQDGQREARRAKSGQAVGTTGRGIGPTYASKAYRDGPRMIDLVSSTQFNSWLTQLPHLSEGMTHEQKELYTSAAKILAPFVTDVSAIASEHLETQKSVLLEGAQGGMLDVNFGSYPFVTSSNLVAGSCAGGLGIPPWKVTTILGVVKSYATRVGHGPFVGELFGDLENTLREKGNEFGSTTGRARRVGWIDLVALKYLARINGMTGLALMKSDVLDGFEHVGLVVEYRNKATGLALNSYPMCIEEWNNIEPVVDFCKGWAAVQSSEGQMQNEMMDFIHRIEKHTSVPVQYVSWGPERSQGLFL